MGATRPTYQAIVDVALALTEATSGWLLAEVPDGLRVVATAGAATGASTINDVVEAQGAKAFALASGQPTALLPQAGDVANADGGGAGGIPPSILAVPCGDDDIVGVLEVSGKSDGGAFTFADIEALSGLAHVASVGLVEQDDAAIAVASPVQLGNELAALAERNPGRYANVAAMIEALLSIEQ